ncbi:MAG: hypothetical protein KKD28_13185 [Chloroflexi bacterium]|nr:hypothetical protein [Chloroflexota bacterium]MBU1662414.1 hypothetical protein [Chloroflexota bacterium]
MTLDKELYRKAYESYRQWNEDVLVERARNAGQISTQKLWEQYVGLWEFCVNNLPPQSDLQRKQRLEDWDRYYARVQKLEEWRRGRGKQA